MKIGDMLRNNQGSEFLLAPTCFVGVTGAEWKFVLQIRELVDLDRQVPQKMVEGVVANIRALWDVISGVEDEKLRVFFYVQSKFTIAAYLNTFPRPHSG